MQEVLPVYELNLRGDPRIPFKHHRSTVFSGKGPQNWNENTEFLYCTAGEGYITYNDRWIPVRESQLVVVNSEMFHSVYTEDYMEYHSLIMDRHFCRDSGIPTNQMYFQELIEDPEICGKFMEILKSLQEYHEGRKNFLAASVRARTLDFLTALCRDYLEEENRTPGHQSSQLVRTTMAYIRKHLPEPMTLDSIAENVGVNKFYLSREFKRVSGRTIFDVIVQLRCAAARELIEQGSSVSQAARDSGFENLSYFTRTFKKYYQEIPSRYRKLPEV